ncbi:hypothetical protein [Microbacterium sp.]|uniref:hypothetical protein n=1 Tax=Microbacterium sp. TaxID=51671 RepID=UPI00334084B6
MDIVDEFGQSPRCPECGILLREVRGGWRCPECSHAEDAPWVSKPDDGGAPSIHGG